MCIRDRGILIKIDSPGVAFLGQQAAGLGAPAVARHIGHRRARQGRRPVRPGGFQRGVGLVFVLEPGAELLRVGYRSVSALLPAVGLEPFAHTGMIPHHPGGVIGIAVDVVDNLGQDAQRVVPVVVLEPFVRRPGYGILVARGAVDCCLLYTSRCV